MRKFLLTATILCLTQFNPLVSKGATVIKSSIIRECLQMNINIFKSDCSYFFNLIIATAPPFSKISFIYSTHSFSDTSNPNKEFNDLLIKYKNGERNSNFLKKLLLMANEEHDKSNTPLIANDYIRSLKYPFSKEELYLIGRNTNSSNDPGFNIFIKNSKYIDSTLGEGKAAELIKIVIFKEYIKPIINDTITDSRWNKMEKTIVKKFGNFGEEILWRTKVITYYNNKDWENFAKSATPYINKYWKNLDEIELNNFAWSVFLNINNYKLLSEALKWSEKTLKDHEWPEGLDTYANLLYKLGKRENAIFFENKALKIADDESKREIQAKLEKMGKGEKTW